jgi:hypothetical protein
MGIGTSVFVIAVGAILAFAVDVDTEGFNLNTIGIILMAVGAIGLVFTALVWGPRRRVVADRTVVAERPVTYRDEVV